MTKTLTSAPAPTVPGNETRQAKVGVLGVGHHTYWHQFEGLRAEMLRKLNHLGGILQSEGVEVVCFGLLDNAQAAYAAICDIQAAAVDVLFVDMCTYATSSTFGVLCRSLRVPIVLVALQPLKAMDYARGTTYMQLCNDDFCSVPEFTGVALRLGRPAPPVILGTENDDPLSREELRRWCGIARVLHSLRTARLGLMGHVLEAMLDMHADPTAITRAFGLHVALIEPHDLLRHFRAGSEAAIREKEREILEFFDTPDPVSDPLTERLTARDLHNAAHAAVALDGLIAEKELDGLAYYYEAHGDDELQMLVTNLVVGNSLLTGRGFPMCGEYDIKTCVAMMIMDRLGIGGSFAEFHPIDFTRNSVLVGHDGPHHISIAAAKPVVRSLKKFHGKPGAGASVEFQICTGPITMLSIGQTANGQMKFILAEGESRRGPIPPTGNTNTHGVFGDDVRRFLLNWVREGPTHHFALGVGHYAQTIAQVADCLGIESIIVR